MIRPHSFLEVAENLAWIDKGRPKQASLRRSISTAYYALFHLLIQTALDQLLGAEKSLDRRRIRERAARWFEHHQMAATCEIFKAPVVVPKMSDLIPRPASRELQSVARIFVELQQARHEADYDPAKLYNRQMVSSLLDNAKEAFQFFKQASKDPMWSLFLLMLLTGEKVVKR